MASVILDVLRTSLQQVDSLSEFDLIGAGIVVEVSICHHDCFVRLLMLKEAQHCVLCHGGEIGVVREPLFGLA